MLDKLLKVAERRLENVNDTIPHPADAVRFDQNFLNQLHHRKEILEEVIGMLNEVLHEEPIERNFPIGSKFRYIPDDEEENRKLRGKICTVVNYVYDKDHICYNAISNSIEVKFDGMKSTMFVEQEELQKI